MAMGLKKSPSLRPLRLRGEKPILDKNDLQYDSFPIFSLVS
jgi:hypothetical protein